MLNALRPLFAKLLTPLGRVLAGTPVTPNMVTVAGTLGVAVGALWLFPTGHLFAGTLVCWGFAMFDMLDGLLARVKGTSGAMGRVPRLDPGPGGRRRGLLRPGYLAGPGRASVGPGRRCALLSGGRQHGVLRPGPGRRARGQGGRRGGGALRAAAGRAGGGRADRPGRAVRAGHRALGGRGGQYGHVRPAGVGGAESGRRPRAERGAPPTGARSEERGTSDERRGKSAGKSAPEAQGEQR